MDRPSILAACDLRFISDQAAQPKNAEIAMFTTEDTEFTERTERNGRCDSSVCSVYSVVKSVTRNRSMLTLTLTRTEHYLSGSMPTFTKLV